MSGVAKKLMSASGGAVESDEFFNNVSLLLHGDGTDGAQNNTFLDGSTNNFTIARNGNTTQGAFSPYGDRWSNYFDGTDSLAFTGATSGAGDFTTEAWVNLSALLNYNVILDNRASGGSTTGYALGVTETGAPYMYTSNAFRIVSSITITANTWNHVALVRSGTTVTLYVNGVSGGTYTSSANFSDTNNLIGVTPTFGYISDVRVVNGTAIYTSSFTPPTEPLTAVAGTSLLTCQSNRFKDNSVNNFTLTKSGDVSVTKFSPYLPTEPYDPSTFSGSAYFDGTGDSLSVPAQTALSFGTGNFTIEGWIYLTATPAVYAGFIDSRGVGGDAYAFGILNSAGLKLDFFYGTGRVTSTSTVAINQWVHCAVTRSSGTIRFFINGVLDSATVLYTPAINANRAAPLIGQLIDPFFFSGLISDLRVVKGTALYTSSFTPPMEPLTPVANTSLLCNFTNAAIFDSAAKNVLETVGNAQIDTAVTKFGTGSMYFDGTGDSLSVPSNVENGIGTSDFTVEAWIHPTATHGNRHITDSTSAGGLFLKTEATTVGIGGATIATHNMFSFTFSPNQWYHVAFCRQGSTVYGFVDGVQIGSGANTVNYTSPTGLTIGNAFSLPAGWIGYIDDLRITKGVARYTANFTPRSRAFPDQ
jgi:hypothetical protein